MTKNSVSKLMNPQGQQQQGYGTQMGTQFSPGQMQNNKRPKLGSQNMQRSVLTEIYILENNIFQGS